MLPATTRLPTAARVWVARTVALWVRQYQLRPVVPGTTVDVSPRTRLQTKAQTPMYVLKVGGISLNAFPVNYLF